MLTEYILKKAAKATSISIRNALQKVSKIIILIRYDMMVFFARFISGFPIFSRFSSNLQIFSQNGLFTSHILCNFSVFRISLEIFPVSGFFPDFHQIFRFICFLVYVKLEKFCM